MPTTVNHYLQFQHDKFVAIGPLLGQTANASEQVQFNDGGRRTYAGLASSDGPTVEITFWSMPDPLANLPLIARWLATQDCSVLRYNLGTGRPVATKGLFIPSAGTSTP